MSQLQHWLRQYLGIADLVRNQQAMYSDLASFHNKISIISTKLGILNQSTARISAKLDPHHSRSELDPKMKAESDEITEREIKRLHAEQAVRDQYGYTPKGE